MATFPELIIKVTRALSQVPGTAVQIYAEDRIADILQSVFDLVFEEVWWPEYMVWETKALDGSTGIITTDSTITKYVDIKAIYRSGFDTPLTALPDNIEPFSISGTTPLYISENSTVARPFKIWPVTSTGNIVTRGRARPGAFDAANTTTDVLLDSNLLIWGTTWMYCEDDGANPAQAAKFQTLFEGRLKQAKGSLNQLPIVLDPRLQSYNVQWREV